MNQVSLALRVRERTILKLLSCWLIWIQCILDVTYTSLMILQPSRGRGCYDRHLGKNLIRSPCAMHGPHHSLASIGAKPQMSACRLPRCRFLPLFLLFLNPLMSQLFLSLYERFEQALSVCSSVLKSQEKINYPTYLIGWSSLYIFDVHDVVVRTRHVSPRCSSLNVLNKLSMLYKNKNQR